MRTTIQACLAATTLAVILGAAQPARAYPPAPDHQIYGTVRNQFGDPLMVSGATITFAATGGVQLTTSIVPGLEAGANYRLSIPMDAGLTPDMYKSTALIARVPFTMTVRVGPTVYVPMELVGNLRTLGNPAQSTRIDMTLGVDSDLDGLPDAWELDLIDLLGGGLGLGDIRPNDDSDGDGITNYREYLAGTYAWDSTDAFTLTVVDRVGDADVIEFLAIIGRSYTVSRSADLRTWNTVPFRIPADGDVLQSFYPATDVRMLKIHVPVETNGPAAWYYRATVQ